MVVAQTDAGGVTIMGLRHRIKPEHLVAYRKWKCAICATVLGRRRAFSARPHDATLPHPGKVWQVDSVAYRFAPWYAAIFCDVATHVSYTYKHATTSSDHMVLVMSRHRAQIRPTHGEIEIILSDPLTAMRSRDVQSYAADEQVTGHGKGFSLKVGPQGVHEWVSICENKIGDLVLRSNAALRNAGRHERWQHLAFCSAESIKNNYYFMDGTTTTPMSAFMAGATPPLPPPHCPIHVWGSTCTYTTHPETRGSKYEDRSLPGWYCGPSMRNGPNDYSMAGIVTVHGNVIAWDYGMVKLISAPVMKRLEPNGLPLFESVLPDPSIVVEIPKDTTVNILPPRVVPFVPAIIIPAVADGPVTVRLDLYKTAYARKAAGT